jgi:parallel beta-helix repeat protein
MLSNNSRYLLNLILVLFVAFKLSAQDPYYVSALMGNDSNVGTIDAPFETINRGIAEVSAGDTVYVMNGEYKNQGYGTASAHPSDGELSENMSNPQVVTINKSGTEGNYITIRNYPNHSPKIIFDGKGGILISGPQSYIIIEGFEIEGPAAGINYNMANADREWKIKCHVEGLNYNHNYFSGFGIWGGFSQNFLHHHIIIRNNIVHHTTGSGIRFNDSDHITIENNTVYNTTWWTSNASSAIVFAEAIARSDQDNGDDIKMIMRGNTVYNNWNRILFYKTNEPPNSGNDNPTYGTAAFTQIWDGQGLYVTRSDDSYNGTFLFENNLCVNNGKNGINFDHSIAASGLMRNNTIYYNGVHEIIQDLSVAEGNTAHRGQKVGGLKANKVKNITVLNNIVMTRDNNFSALELPNIYGSVKVATNNIFVNGNVAFPGSQVTANQINIDPLFVNAPSVVNGPIDMSTTDFSLQSNSPAINGGLQSNTPTIDILGNPRPTPPANVIAYSSFEGSLSGWTAWSTSSDNNDIELSTDTAKTGDYSIKVYGRTKNFHSARFTIDQLVAGNTYTIYLYAKLPAGASGTAEILLRKIENGSGESISLGTPVPISSNQWTLIEVDYTHSNMDSSSYIFVKGPDFSNNIGVDYYLDDFSIVPQGDNEVDFSTAGNIVDIGAYEYQAGLSVSDNPMQAKAVYAYPNPTKDILTLINLTEHESVTVYDVLGRKQSIQQQRNPNRLKLNVSNLKRGLYFINVTNNNGQYKGLYALSKNKQ